jgi:uncharacterized protein DUF4136
MLSTAGTPQAAETLQKRGVTGSVTPPTKDFSKYKTYKWVDPKGVDHADQLTEKQIKEAIDANLATKGYRKPILIQPTCTSIFKLQSAQRSNSLRTTRVGVMVQAGTAAGMGTAAE